MKKRTHEQKDGDPVAISIKGELAGMVACVIFLIGFNMWVGRILAELS